MRREVRADGAYLVPLRLFIGLGWLRAFAEKLTEPGWRNGSSLATFLTDHMQPGDVAYPPYEALITQVFLPHAALLGLLIMLGQLLAGTAILAGGFTNAALLGGLFMNLNFLLAGAPNPSAFYIVMQLALLVTNAGASLGLDSELSKISRNPLLVAQPAVARRRRQQWRLPLLAVGALSLATAVYSLAHVTDWSPAGSVEDPAMIVTVVAMLSLAWAAIAWLRNESWSGRGLRRRDAVSRRRGEGVSAVDRPPRPQGRLAVTFSVTWSRDDDGEHGPPPPSHSVAQLPKLERVASSASANNGVDALGAIPMPRSHVPIVPGIGLLRPPARATASPHLGTPRSPWRNGPEAPKSIAANSTLHAS